ncbi:neuraminidase-like domain-containing protein, partial [Kibdelosporangium lantanae]
ALREMLAAKYGGDDWRTLAGQIHDELNVIRRDALVAFAGTRSPELSTAQDLYEHLLVDVQTGSAAAVSRISEAIAATQLYLQRYFLDLEPVIVPAGRDPVETRQRLRTSWSWMHTYRVWEANRKVFLYPENYLRPELRTGKTPAFTALESDLLQGQVTADAVQRAYKRYLDEYTEVSRLTIAGGYVHPTGPTLDLVLFGRTRTAPRRYYQRVAEVSA